MRVSIDALFYLCIEILFSKLSNRNQGFIDKKGNEVINLQYDFWSLQNRG